MLQGGKIKSLGTDLLPNPTLSHFSCQKLEDWKERDLERSQCEKESERESEKEVGGKGRREKV